MQKIFSDNKTERVLNIALGERPTFLYCGYDSNGKLHIAGKHNSGIIDHAEIWGYDSDWIGEQDYPLSKKQFDMSIDVPGNYSKYKIILVAQDSTQSQPAVLNFQKETNTKAGSNGLDIAANMYHDRIVIKVSSKNLLASIPTIQIENNGVADNNTLCAIPLGETAWITSVPISETPENHMYIKATAYDQSLNQVIGESVIDFSVLKEFSNSIVYSPDSLLAVYSAPISVFRSTPVMIKNETVQSSKNTKGNFKRIPYNSW